MLSNFRILYVEDDIDTQRYMEFYLSDEVKEFYQAYDGKDGIEKYKIHKPDIIITDLNMPKLNGINMIKEIKKIDKDQIIIITSAFGDRDSLIEALNNGADGFIPKPIDIEVLNNKLLELTSTLKEKKDKDIDEEDEKKLLYQLAHYDNLTNIDNRFSFNKKLSQMMAKNMTFSLFFIDLDNFKPINDSYGHKAGDEVLMGVVSSISKVIKKGDIFARLGGDEFALIIENVTDKEDLKKMKQKIIEATSNPISYYKHTLMVTCSIGISSYPKDSKDKDELIGLADEAMYRAKERGRELPQNL
jgi:diguanylate cyclase (GGDEF)-like protein